SLRALLHALLEQAGDHQLALAGDDRDLAREQLAAAGRGDREAVGEPHLVALLLLVEAELRHPEVRRDGLRDDVDLLLLAVGDDLPRHLPADAGDLALERADARLARVVVDRRTDRVLAEREG